MTFSFDEIVEKACAYSEGLVDDAASEWGDTWNWIEIYRDGQPCFTYRYQLGPETDQLEAWTANKLEPDMVISIRDTWVGLTPTNPLTGQIWGPGEIGLVRDEHRGVENGWVRESLLVLAASRGGETAVRCMPYTRTIEGTRWHELEPEAAAVVTNLYTSVASSLFGVLVAFPPRSYVSVAERERAQAVLDLETMEVFLTNPVEGSPYPGQLIAEPGTARYDKLREYYEDDWILSVDEFWMLRHFDDPTE